MRCALAVLLLLAAPAQAKSRHHLLFRFAVVGGCRLEQKDAAAQAKTNPSSANMGELEQTFRDLSKIRPRFTFFTGDIVNNLVADKGQTLQSQLNAWIKVARRSPLWGHSEIACMPGNHEVLQWLDPHLEVPNDSTYPIWQGFVKNHDLARRGGNGPTLKSHPDDHLTFDQSYTTYSFSDHGVHFVVVNTDSPNDVHHLKTGHTYASWVPVHWIEDDVRKAEADPAVRSIVMLGHKPLHQVALGGHHTPIINGSRHQLSHKLERMMVNTRKFRAYLTGHEHLWHAARISPRGPWQIIIGNGGTWPDEPWRSKGYFGFTLFNVYADGDIGVVDYRRPIPKPYYAPGAPARPRPEWMLSTGKPSP